VAQTDSDSRLPRVPGTPEPDEEMKMKNTGSKTSHTNASQKKPIGYRLKLGWPQIFVPAVFLSLACLATGARAQEALWKTYMDAGTIAYDEAQEYGKAEKSEGQQKRRERYAEAAKRFELARREAEAFGPRDLRLATTLQMLISAYVQQDKFAEAEPFGKKVIAIWKQSADPDSMKRAIAHREIADLYYRKARYAESEPFYQRAVAILEKDQTTKSEVETEVPQSREELLATIQQRLMIVYLGQDKFAEAVPLRAKLVARWKQMPGSDLVKTANSAGEIGNLYFNKRKYSEAELFYQIALHCVEETQASTEERRYIPNLQYSLAGAYYGQRKYADAETLLKQALAIAEKELGTGASLVGQIDHRLALTYEGQQKYADAERTYQQAVIIFEKNSDVESVIGVLDDLGDLYRSRGENALAEPIYRRIVTALESDKDAEPTKFADYLMTLGVVYLAEEKHAEGLQAFERVRLIYDKTLKSNDRRRATIRNNTAKAYYLLARYAEAEPLYLEAIEMEKAAGGESSAAWDEKNYALLLYARGDKERAEPLFRQAIANIANDRDGERQVATSWFELADLYRRQERYSDAAPLFKQALELRLKALKPGHLDLAVTMERYAGTLRKLGRQAEAAPLEEQARLIRSKHALQP
jgi:tetratricopeptide (TPR) repeat protein